MSDHNRDLIILEKIEQNPDVTQALIANQLGVAVGTVNWHLKRLIQKGYVKVSRVARRKLLYIITPEGLALRANLAVDYIQSSFELYRLVRSRMQVALKRIQDKNYQAVRIIGEGDVADICRLTCLEKNVAIVQDSSAPQLIVVGLKIFIDWGDGVQIDPNEPVKSKSVFHPSSTMDERKEYDE